jgi:hypothetical protein
MDYYILQEKMSDFGLKPIMKIANIFKPLLIGGTFSLETSVSSSLLFEVSFREAMIVGLVFMAILGAVFALEGDTHKS